MATPSDSVVASNNPPAKTQSPDVKPDPANKIEPYNWDQLTEQFDIELRKYEDEEAELYREFQELTNYFSTWASSMHHSDSERAVKRLKTRVTKVQMSEDSLEQKRQHYLSVVQAFKTALQLLNGG